MLNLALITGATRGIGRAIALKLANNGIKVIGTATTQSGADTISSYLENFAGTGIVLDVNNKDNISQVISDITAKHGDISILVNNAGITRDNLFLRMKDSEWDEVIDTNLKSVFLMTKAVIRSMTAKRMGRIINITSVIGFMGNAGQVNYSSSKAGIVGFTKSLAREVGGRNITVNCVAPGFITTDMTEKLSSEVKAQYIKNIPLGKMGSAEDIANSVAFLASDNASYITGTTLHVNGGIYM